MNSYFSLIEKWRMPETAVADCLAEMSIDGRSGNEGIVLFLGRDDGDVAELTHLVKLRGPDIKKYPNFISIGASLFNEVTNLASEHGARLIGQVHSHGPGYSLDLSPTDRRYGLHAPFYLSLVAPDYALSRKPVETWGIHVYMENRGYVRLTPAEISRRIEIVLGAKLPDLTAGGDE
jgi:proteasome lid subunit RPN8/RPN11